MVALTLGKEIASGSLAAGFTATLFSPLELVKTRLQVQDDPVWRHASGGGRLYPDGFLATLRRIAAEDGLFLLWRHGFAGFVGRDLLYSGIRIGCYPSVRGWVAGAGTHKDEITLGTKVLAGLITGAFGSCLANPLDVMRVRMSVEGGRLDANTGRLETGMRRGHFPQYANSAHCLLDVWRREGVVGGLWKGTSATMARAALLSSGNLASYDHSKVMIRRQGWMEEGPRLHVVCAIISGLVATTACNPADVIKSRVMMARGEGESISVTQAVVQVVRQQGFRGFMSGWCPAYCRAGPAYFIQMPVVEGLRHLFGVESL
uniref:Mitochondrial carrier protein n=1 Tax=Alexandrium monilatum TaxID=311494 RepID=A0A7S4Q7G0_9DINO